jgi:hypothetical protein
MDENNKSLKVWITFCLENYKASWLLNYRGGSFLLLMPRHTQCQIRGVSFEVLSDGEGF